MEWYDAIGGNANSLPGDTLSMWCLAEDLYFDVIFESWTSGNNGGGFSYWRQLVTLLQGLLCILFQVQWEAMKLVMEH